MSKPLESPSDLADKHSQVDDDVHVSALPSLARTGALGTPSHAEDNILPDEKGSDTASQTSVYIPQKYRWIAFSMIIFFATGSSFAEGILGPLKSTLVRELKVNNAQYGAIASADNLINTILPIIGGIGIDYWGATYAAILASSFVLLGNIVASTSAHTGHYQTLIAGRVIAGLGSTVIEGTQNKLFAHWFGGSYIAFIFALDIAWNRVTTIFSRAAAVPMSQFRGFWGWALWFPTITCAFNLALCIGYWAYERNVPVQYRPKLGREARKAEGWDRRKFALGYLTKLPKFFYILCGTQLFQNAAVSVYSSNLADVQTVTRGTSTLAAGYNSSIQGVIPILLTPLVGAFFDRYGWRMAFVSGTAALYIVVFVLIGFTKVHPLAPIMISSFALTSNALTFIAAIPVLVGDDRYLGTAFGIWKAFQNCNTTILEVAAGAIQDRTPGQTYDRVFYLLIAIKSIEVLWGPVYDVLDGRWLNHSLRRPEQVRLRIRRQSPGLEGWKVSKLTFGIVGGQLGCMIIVSWVVYIVYSLGT